LKVLLVEDNDEMRRLLKSMLAAFANEIYEAGDGGEAVELYGANLPDWVVMDIFMKPNDGLTAAAAMKAIDPDARIIFVSNHTDERTRRAASAAGGIAFFGKDNLLSLLAFLAKQ
jgi:two-component system chemotaxis response regulator CheY